MTEHRLAERVADFMHQIPGGRWTGRAGDLHAALDLPPEFPANWLARRLRQAVGHLHGASVTVSFTRTPLERTIHLCRLGVISPDADADDALQQERAAREAQPSLPNPPGHGTSLAMRRAGGRF